MITNFDVVIDDVEYQWSLGVYPTREKADEKIRRTQMELSKAGHTLGDHEFEIEETDEKDRGFSIWPADKEYDDWVRARKCRKKRAVM